MCSFIFSTKYDGQDISNINKFLKYRGPDHTEVLQKEGMLFVHNLLSITGEFKPQPIVDDEIILVYNGEIYNYQTFGDYKSDGECLIPLYRKFGPEFIQRLDGEFTICLVDLNKKQIVISTDIFKTKPMFISIDGPVIGCAGYRYALERLGHKKIETAKANTILQISMETGKVLKWYRVYEFSLKQHKTSYDDWVTAFRNSIKKRVINTTKKIFIGLSSGYDSGAIYAELLKVGCMFMTFTLTGTENNEVLFGRIMRGNDKVHSVLCGKAPCETATSLNHLLERTEPFQYTIHSQRSSYNEYKTRLIDDFGTLHLATVCRMARKEDGKICLSGTGADEIISDYGFGGKSIYQHSNFGGKFPRNLEDIFPWASFYGSTMESYIAKDEYVGGCYGIEMRYPFLDKNLVQEFLWLSCELKNRIYKAPLDYYLRLEDMPFIGEKRGF